MYLVNSQPIFLLFKLLLHLFCQVVIIVRSWFVEVRRQTLGNVAEHFLEASGFLHMKFVSHFVGHRKFWVQYIFLEFVRKNMCSLEHFQIIFILIFFDGVSRGITNIVWLSQRLLTLVWLVLSFFQDLRTILHWSIVILFFNDVLWISKFWDMGLKLVWGDLPRWLMVWSVGVRSISWFSSFIRRVEIHGLPILWILEAHVVLGLAHIGDERMNFLVFVCVREPTIVQVFLKVFAFYAQLSSQSSHIFWNWWLGPKNDSTLANQLCPCELDLLPFLCIEGRGVPFGYRLLLLRNHLFFQIYK